MRIGFKVRKRRLAESELGFQTMPDQPAARSLGEQGLVTGIHPDLARPVVAHELDVTRATARLVGNEQWCVDREHALSAGMRAHPSEDGLVITQSACVRHHPPATASRVQRTRARGGSGTPGEVHAQGADRLPPA